MDLRSKVKKRTQISDPLKLHRAKSEEKVLAYLSREGVYPRARDENGDTPIHAYIRNNKIDCLFAFLINVEYEIDVLNEGQDTPLHLACKVKSLNCVKALVAFDADLNIFNKDSLTPLDIAKNGDCGEIVQLLKDVGGLTSLAILNAQHQPQDIMDMAFSYGGATGLIHGQGGGRVTENLGGMNHHALTSKLQDVKASGREDVGYQWHKGAEKTDHYFPKEKRNVDFIPEDEEEGVAAIDKRKPIAQQPIPETAAPLQKTENSDSNVEAPGKVTEKHDVPTSGGPDFFERLAESVCICLEKMDHKTNETLESFLKETLQEKDYKEWLCYEVKTRRRPKPGGPIENIHKKATDYLYAKKEISTTSSKEHPLTPMKQHHQRRKHNDATDYQLLSPRHVHFARPAIGESLRSRRFRDPHAAQESNLCESKSLFNPKMLVIQSGLGTSVMPGQMKTLKKGQRGHKILCLDGGGIKIEILRAIERLSGCAIPELFDWIVGTSIGGIVALGMVYGNKSGSDLQKICFKMKDSVFKKKTWLKYTYDSKALENLLIDMFGEGTKMTEKRKPRVMITAVSKEDTKLPLVVFNNCFNDGYCDDSVWKVARYTSAAPVYFKAHDNYIDGGLVANNPCNHGLTKIKMFLRDLKERQKKSGEKMTIATDIACVVSLGCGDFPPKSIGNCDIEDLDVTNIFHAKERIKNVIQTLLACIGRSEDDAQICRTFCEEMQIPFYRLNPLVSQEMGTTETDNLKICDCIISAKKMVYKDEAHLEALVRHLSKEPIPQTRITAPANMQ